MTDYSYIIVGSGLSGAVIAERLANVEKKKVLILESRDHIGGNCYDYIDDETGLLLNKYGAHIFHTNCDEVWEYINRFDKWERWEHKVVTHVDNKYVPMPVNITTINMLCNENLKNEEDVNKWLEKKQIKYDKITNSEQMAKSRIGEELYDKLIKNYTYKQWNKYPEELDKSVLERIPIRASFDTRYFSDKYQALPKNGYTEFFKKLLDNPLIHVELNTDFFEYKKTHDISNKQIIYTGPIDTYFSSIGLPKLEYRSIDFKIERIKNVNYYQPNSVVNYPELDVPYTRIIEYKHFLNQKSPDTIIVSEETNDVGEPYYPVPNAKNLELYEKYKKMADDEKNVHFVGRLANYKYFNMDQAIKNALDFYENISSKKAKSDIILDELTSSHCIVVARYKEDLSWLDTLCDMNEWINNIIVYNKGPNNIFFKHSNKIKIIKLPNIGREGETYLHYIINNYDNLPKRVWFTQGNPFDHSPDFMSLFSLQSVMSYKKFQTLTYRYMPALPPANIMKKIGPDNYVNGNRCNTYWISKKTLQISQGLYFYDEGMNPAIFGVSKNIGIPYNQCYDYVLKLINIDKKYITPRTNVPFCFSAIFYVESNLILQHKKDVYDNLRKYLLKYNNQGGAEGYIIERMWAYIFTGLSIQKESKYLLIIPIGNTISEHFMELFNENRNYNICIVSYDRSNPKTNAYLETNAEYYFLYEKTTATESFYLLLKNNTFWKDYEYIMRIDDDIKINYLDINSMFNDAFEMNIDICQASLIGENISHNNIRSIPNSYYRKTDFIEVQMPMFKKEFLENTIYNMLKNYVEILRLKSGWGLDIHWSRYATENNLKIIIFDKYKGIHTRPVHSFKKNFDEMHLYMNKMKLK